MWSIEFSSSDFLPFLPEKCQANPGVYGFELALWVARALAERGVITSYPLGEDWGWFVELLDGDTEVMIGCSSVADEGEGYAGKPIQWGIFLKPRPTLKQRLQGKSAAATIDRLAAALSAALQDRQIKFRLAQA
jgi:hypothetical protein